MLGEEADYLAILTESDPQLVDHFRFMAWEGLDCSREIDALDRLAELCREEVLNHNA